MRLGCEPARNRDESSRDHSFFSPSAGAAASPSFLSAGAASPSFFSAGAASPSFFSPSAGAAASPSFFSAGAATAPACPAIAPAGGITGAVVFGAGLLSQPTADSARTNRQRLRFFMCLPRNKNLLDLQSFGQNARPPTHDPRVARNIPARHVFKHILPSITSRR